MDLRITDDLAVLSPTGLEAFDVVVNWTTFVDPEPVQVEALVDAVRAGTGFVALHGGGATFWNNADYLTMLGSRFVTHGPYKRFIVEINDSSHPITEGVSDFETDDELYEIGGNVAEFAEFAEAYSDGRPHEEYVNLGAGPLRPETTILASAEGYPLLYTRTFVAGRVHYNALGHDRASLCSPGYRRLVVQGVRWAASRERLGSELEC